MSSKIEEIMEDTFSDVLDRVAPKQPDGSIERKIGLAVGAEIIAKTLIALPTLIEEEKKKAVEKYANWLDNNPVFDDNDFLNKANILWEIYLYQEEKK